MVEAGKVIAKELAPVRSAEESPSRQRAKGAMRRTDRPRLLQFFLEQYALSAVISRSSKNPLPHGVRPPSLVALCVARGAPHTHTVNPLFAAEIQS